MYKFSSIKAEVLSNLLNNPAITPRELNMAVNRAYQRTASALDGINTDYTLTINTATPFRMLPDQVIDTKEVRYIDSDTDHGTILKQSLQLFQGEEASGIPASFYLDNPRTRDYSVIYFNPSPSTGTIQIDCRIIPSALTDDDAEMRLKDDEMDIVINLASSFLAARYNPQMYALYKNEYKDALFTAQENRKRMQNLTEFPTLEVSDDYYNNPLAWLTTED